MSLGCILLGCSAGIRSAETNGDASATDASPASASSAPSRVMAVPVPLPKAPLARDYSDVVLPSAPSVSRQKPGGDAPDPHAAALARLLSSPMGMLRDKDDQVRVFLPDAPLWKRVRYRSFEHLVGFKYGSDFNGVSVLITVESHGGRAAESLACLRRAETMARPRLRALSVELDPIQEMKTEWRGQPVTVHTVDGMFPWGWKRVGFSAAWVAYPAYGTACLVQGVGFRHGDRPDLARMARDRWILQAVARTDARTSYLPRRH